MRCGCDRGGEVERGPGLCVNARRIDQPEAADPDTVLRTRRKRRQQVATLIVGDDDLGVAARAQTGRFRDDPHPGFRPLRARHDPSNVGGANPHLLGTNLAWPSRQERGDARRYHACVQGSFRAHATLPIEISTFGHPEYHCIRLYTPKSSGRKIYC